jgi:hypothetical protein
MLACGESPGMIKALAPDSKRESGQGRDEEQCKYPGDESGPG